MDCLLDAYQTIWEELPFLGAYHKLFSDRVYMKTILSWIYQDILDFHREAMVYFRDRGEIRVVFDTTLVFLATLYAMLISNISLEKDLSRRLERFQAEDRPHQGENAPTFRAYQNGSIPRGTGGSETPSPSRERGVPYSKANRI